jgi:bifunctional DNA-binding transcriptional regulator/antitoxin component of YhaV-PrlF toxin-antitoxin module
MEAAGATVSPDSKARSGKIFTRKLRLDSKGRLLLPVEIRRNYGLDSDADIAIAFSLEKNIILLLINNDGPVADAGKKRGEEYG